MTEAKSYAEGSRLYTRRQRTYRCLQGRGDVGGFQLGMRMGVKVGVRVGLVMGVGKV